MCSSLSLQSGWSAQSNVPSHARTRQLKKGSQTTAGMEEKLDPEKFIRIHRSAILRKDFITGLKHEGMGVWCAELADGAELRIGRTYLKKVKAMAGR